MISVTNDVMRLAGRDWFSRKCFDNFDKEVCQQNKYIIIPDVRYEHDLHEIRKRGGIIIKIIRNDPSLPHYEWENGIDDLIGDYTIYNSDTLENLHSQSANILNKYNPVCPACPTYPVPNQTE
jgi:hypothetical protein